MKFTLSWLKDHLDTNATVGQIAEGLTRVGLEVEGIENPADRLAPFTIARILTAQPHPQADKLQVLSVDVGDGAPRQIVCGAPNARAGLVGVLGQPGAYVPGLDVTLKVAAIRGVESNGMMCSRRELELSDEHDGIIELPADAPVGAVFAQWAGLDDPVFDVAITPNRQDCMGVAGIARDLAALGLGTLKDRPIALVEGDFPCPIEIRTDDPEGCPAFLGRVVRGVRNGPSPEWLARRLTAIGQRPISALVDITNYLMIDRGRPLHVYDLAKLQGALVARKARAGETVEALNGKTYALDESMTVIADDVAVHDIGGIMGGEHSSVTPETIDVLIECAWFDPASIGATGRKLGLTSDARSRFERGVDPAFLDAGLALATRLVQELAGGEASTVAVAGKPPIADKVVAFDPALTERLAGISVPSARQAEILASLGFRVDQTSPWSVGVPSWRRDVDGAADLVEEVVRVEGLDRVPSTPLPRGEGVARATATPAQKMERRARRAMASRGFNEAVTWSFISPAEAAVFGGGAWTLENPISADLAVMRPSLLPGLAAAARRNMDRGAESVRLFEIGRRYLADGEPATLAVVMAGNAGPRDWRGGKTRGFDAFDAKAEAIAALAAAGAPVDRLQVLSPAGPAWHPGRSGKLCLGPKQVLAEFGELHPAAARALGLKGQVVAAEVNLAAIPPRRDTGHARPAYAPPILQSVKRDFAFLAPADVAADALLRAVKGADKQAIVDVALFDVFTGQGVAEGQKSLAVEVTLQPGTKSFTDEEIQAISDRIIAAAAKQGAVLRG